MNVIAVSITAVSGSTTIEYETCRLPALNHVTDGATIRCTASSGSPTSRARVQRAIAQAPAAPRTTGQWLRSRKNLGPRNAAIAAPSNGNPGISHKSGSDIAVLGPGVPAVGGSPRRLQSGRRQCRQRFLRRRRRQRLRIDGRLLIGLAQILPQAHVE